MSYVFGEVVLLIFLAFCVVLFSFCLVCLRSVSYVTNVASVSELPILYFAPSLFSYVYLCLDEYSTIIYQIIISQLFLTHTVICKQRLK